jgi:hypothetical protein
MPRLGPATEQGRARISAANRRRHAAGRAVLAERLRGLEDLSHEEAAYALGRHAQTIASVRREHGLRSPGRGRRLSPEQRRAVAALIRGALEQRAALAARPIAPVSPPNDHRTAERAAAPPAEASEPIYAVYGEPSPAVEPAAPRPVPRMARWTCGGLGCGVQVRRPAPPADWSPRDSFAIRLGEMRCPACQEREAREAEERDENRGRAPG